MLKNFKLLLILLLLPLIGLSSGRESSFYQKEDTKVVAKQLDKRAQVLAAYLAKYNSPLQYHAQDFIEAADTYGVDWKLVPAISGVESTFGKQIPGGYNAWGWAIYNPNSRFGFKSWNDGIYTVTQGLKENYINDGLTDPYKMNRRYAASPTWGAKVTYFIADLEKFTNSYKSEKVDNLIPQAGNSAQLN